MIVRGLIVLILLTSEPARSQPPLPEALARGASPDQVRRLLGPPDRISRQILFRRHIEQWHYHQPPRLIEFNFVRGEEPILVRDIPR